MSNHIERRKKYFPEVSDAEWNDWKWQVRNRVETLEDLKKYLTLTKEEEEGISESLKTLRMAITPYYLTLIDPELSLLAQYRDQFEAIGVTVIGSSYELCERALDKLQMYNWLTGHGYNCAKSYVDKEQFYADVEAGLITYPVFVKPVCGSASISISKVYDKETVELLFAHSDNLMIQEFLDGQEIGADVYIDMISGEVVSIFTKKKIVMRAGETDKAVSFKDPVLFELIERFAQESGWSGQIDIDIFDVDGHYYISEVNPRFGGGYPHAYECGCNHMDLIIHNLNGIKNEQRIGAYDDGVYMMKYNEIMMKKG